MTHRKGRDGVYPFTTSQSVPIKRFFLKAVAGYRDFLDKLVKREMQELIFAIVPYLSAGRARG